MNFKQNMLTSLYNMSTIDYKWTHYDFEFKYDRVTNWDPVTAKDAESAIKQLSQPGILRDTIQ